MSLVYSVVHKQRKRKLPWALQLRVIQQTAIGMKYLHSKNMLHLDLKTPNILLTESCQVKVQPWSCFITHSVNTIVIECFNSIAVIAQISGKNASLTKQSTIFTTACAISSCNNTDSRYTYLIYMYIHIQMYCIAGELHFFCAHLTLCCLP